VKGQWKGGDTVKRAYDSFAPVFDEFTRGSMHERWMGRLVATAEQVGMNGRRLLDIACGTGMSSIPMLEQGWTVTGCDISSAMVARARKKVGEAAELFEADMRELPDLGAFDLVWAINDPINYLLDIEELEATLDGMRRNLAPTGVALFDINTLVTYRNFFSKEVVIERDGRRMVWSGQQKAAKLTPGMLAEARFEVEGAPDLSHLHRQRHFREAEVLAALDAVGLRCISVFGELEGDLTPGVDEELHTKAVYLCRHR
jgi:SAM-dependent methyltransferase